MSHSVEDASLNSPKSLIHAAHAAFKNSQAIGWIPCLSGDLNFSLMRCGMGDDAIEKNDNGYHIVSSIKDWNDYTEDGKDGRFRVILQMHEDQGPAAKGSICIYPAALEEENPEMKDLIGLVCRAGMPGEELDHAIEAAMQSIPEVYLIHYETIRSGLSFLKFIDPGREDLVTDREGKRLLMRQAFYYLKYALHNHKHHNDDEDSTASIITLNEGDSLKKATRLLVSDYVGALVLAKRRIKGIERATIDGLGAIVSRYQGKIAYGKSLVAAVEELGCASATEAGRQYKRFDNMAESWLSWWSAEKADFERPVQERRKSDARAMIASTVAIFGVLMFVLWRNFVGFCGPTKDTGACAAIEYSESLLSLYKLTSATAGVWFIPFSLFLFVYWLRANGFMIAPEWRTKAIITTTVEYKADSEYRRILVMYVLAMLALTIGIIFVAMSLPESNAIIKDILLRIGILDLGFWDQFPALNEVPIANDLPALRTEHNAQ